MIRDSYRKEGKTKARFVKKAIGQNFYKWCEQGLDDPRFDVAQGTCDADDLPPEVKARCDEYKGSFYACEWPIGENK